MTVTSAFRAFAWAFAAFTVAAAVLTLLMLAGSAAVSWIADRLTGGGE